MTRDTHIHSISICDSCYSKLKRFELKPVTESTLRAAQKLKTTDLRCEFKDNITIKECSLCYHYLPLGKVGRKRKLPRTPHYEASRNENFTSPGTSTQSQAVSFAPPEAHCTSSSPSSAPSCSSQNEPQLMSVEPLIASTPKKSRRRLILDSNLGPSTRSSNMVDSSALPIKIFYASYKTLTNSSTSPFKHTFHSQYIETALNRQRNLHLTDLEEKLASHLIRRMLAHSKEKNIARVKTGGQPIILQRVSMPMQTSDKASSPTKRRRAKQILAFRSTISGRKTEAIEVQEEKDIRSISTEKARKIIGISEKWKSRKTIPKSYALAMK